MRVFALLALAAITGCSASRPAAPPLSPEDVLPGAIVVDFRDGITKAEYDVEERQWGIDLEFNSIEGDANGVTISRSPVGGNVDVLLAQIRADSDVEDAEPVYLYRASATPNDPRYPEQWHLAQIRMPEAWERSTGKGAIVAVIDTGVAFENFENFKVVEDLDGASFAKGYDFVGDDEHANDDNGHGTHVAGTIAQVTNNKIGVAGVAYDATIMPLKVLSASGSGTSADIADAIRWAADHGAHVINMSLGGGGRSEVMANAIQHARKKGVTVIAAAGNAGRGCGKECVVSWPAAYEGVIAVSAVGPDKKLASYSSWGKELDIAAPGGEKSTGEKNGVLQATIDSQDPSKTVYEFYQGTSMATPHVAGVAALIVASGMTSPDDVERALLESASDQGDKGWDPKYGHGLLDAEAALIKARAGGTRGPIAIGWRIGLAAGLAAVARASLKRRRLDPPSIDLGFSLFALSACTGFFFLRWLGLPHLPVVGSAFELMSTPVPDWERWMNGSATPLFYSALVPFVVAFVSLPFLRTRQAAAGICVGFSAFLLHMAWIAPSIAWIPFRFLSVPWLGVNALVAWLLARELMRYSAERRNT